MSKSTNTYNRQNWEDADFPILCQTCLGDSPYMRMLKEKHSSECKICSRPFTTFKWNPGQKARYKKTEICQTCAKMKNVCQTCIFDLEYGLPVQLRDKALKLGQNIPTNEINREYFLQNAEKELSLTAGSSKNALPYGQLGKSQPASDMLMKLARITPYPRRNLPHICSFFVKGECKRGDECPFRHELPTDPDDPLSQQNLKDRYFGVNDPVAEKLSKRYDAMPKLEAPEDKTVTTLYLGGLVPSIDEKVLRDHFYQFGEIRSINVHPKQRCAFIQYTTRDAAERAADETYDKLILHGKRLTVNWGKSAQAEDSADGGSQPNMNFPAVPGIPSHFPPPPPRPMFMPPQLMMRFNPPPMPPPLGLIPPFPGQMRPRLDVPPPDVSSIPLPKSSQQEPPPPGIYYKSQDPELQGYN